MKISILTPTYNRAKEIQKLYDSLIKNSEYNVDLEWLIMDDGSTDDTKQQIEEFIKEGKLQIYYHYQENKGKMSALNNLIQYATGEWIIECDSDDYLAPNAIKIIKEKIELIRNNNIYAICFLKYNQNFCNIGSDFINENKETTMFDLYYKQGITGDKALVYKSDIRKKYAYKLEKDEKFSTEARMHHEIDKTYKVVCFNKPIMICEYREDGYSNNIKQVFIKNSFGHYEYFKEMLQMDMRGVLLKKRLYIIKHYILFSILTKQKNILKPIKNKLDKLIVILLWLPGKIKTNIWLKESCN